MMKVNNKQDATAAGDPEIGERLATIRLRAGLTQTDLANQIGVSRQHISNIETGLTSPTLHVLTEFLAACGLNLPEFFYGPLPTEQTPKQREYHRKLQTILEDSSASFAIQKVLDSFVTSIESSARAAVQPPRVQIRQLKSQ